MPPTKRGEKEKDSYGKESSVTNETSRDSPKSRQNKIHQRTVGLIKNNFIYIFNKSSRYKEVSVFFTIPEVANKRGNKSCKRN